MSAGNASLSHSPCPFHRRQGKKPAPASPKGRKCGDAPCDEKENEGAFDAYAAPLRASEEALPCRLSSRACPGFSSAAPSTVEAAAAAAVWRKLYHQGAGRPSGARIPRGVPPASRSFSSSSSSSSSFTPLFHFKNPHTTISDIQHHPHYHLLAILTSENEIFVCGTQNPLLDPTRGRWEGKAYEEDREVPRGCSSMGVSSPWSVASGCASVGGRSTCSPVSASCRHEVMAAPHDTSYRDDPPHSMVCVDVLPDPVSQLCWGPWQRGVSLVALCRGKGVYFYHYAHRRWTRDEAVSAVGEDGKGEDAGTTGDVQEMVWWEREGKSARVLSPCTSRRCTFGDPSWQHNTDRPFPHAALDGLLKDRGIGSTRPFPAPSAAVFSVSSMQYMQFAPFGSGTFVASCGRHGVKVFVCQPRGKKSGPTTDGRGRMASYPTERVGRTTSPRVLAVEEEGCRASEVGEVEKGEETEVITTDGVRWIAFSPTRKKSPRTAGWKRHTPPNDAFPHRTMEAQDRAWTRGKCHVDATEEGKEGVGREGSGSARPPRRTRGTGQSRDKKHRKRREEEAEEAADDRPVRREASGGMLEGETEEGSEEEERCVCVAWNPSGRWISAGYRDGSIRLYAVEWRRSTAQDGEANVSEFSLCYRTQIPYGVRSSSPPTLTMVPASRMVCHQLSWAPLSGRSFMLLLAVCSSGIVLYVFQRPPLVSEHRLYITPEGASHAGRRPGASPMPPTSSSYGVDERGGNGGGGRYGEHSSPSDPLYPGDTFHRTLPLSPATTLPTNTSSFPSTLPSFRSASPSLPLGAAGTPVSRSPWVQAKSGPAHDSPRGSSTPPTDKKGYATTSAPGRVSPTARASPPVRSSSSAGPFHASSSTPPSPLPFSSRFPLHLWFSIPLQCGEVLHAEWNSTGTQFMTSHRDSAVHVWRVVVTHTKRRLAPLSLATGEAYPAVPAVDVGHHDHSLPCTPLWTGLLHSGEDVPGTSSLFLVPPPMVSIRHVSMVYPYQPGGEA